MKVAVISDVHGNLGALEAVLKDMKSEGVEALYFAGDAVGYGPEPEECIELLTRECTASVAGNHDHGVTGQTSTALFNHIAVYVVDWTREVLSEDAMNTLKSWPMTVRSDKTDMMVVHANPVKPSSWEYVLSQQQMKLALEFFKERICVVGHSHMPFVTSMNINEELSMHGNGPGKVFFANDTRYLVNAGSVGQPRDQDTRACYILMDDEGIEIKRVEYDNEATAKKIEEKGIHIALAERIRYGF